MSKMIVENDFYDSKVQQWIQVNSDNLGIVKIKVSKCYGRFIKLLENNKT